MKLSTKLKRIRRLSEGQSDALESALLGSMGDTMQTLREMHERAGGSLTKVTIAPGVTLEVLIPVDGKQGWERRLMDIYNACQSAIWSAPEAFSDAPDLYMPEVCRKVLKADGWKLNKYTLKTPAWMEPHAEVRVEELGSDRQWVQDALESR